jgi:hypothetical protein
MARIRLERQIRDIAKRRQSAHLRRVMPKSPLDDPEKALHAWARYRRMMRFMFLLTAGVVAVALALLYDGQGAASVHYYIAVAIGIGGTMLLAGALMGLIFLSSGTGHDENVTDLTDEDPPARP